MQGRVLIIAGSDSGGGAGIQADIKSVTALGGYAATAITALTAQNTTGVFEINKIAPKFVARQIEVVLEDIGADAIKTGMLHSTEVVEAVTDSLMGIPLNIPLVVDPVMVAKGGAALLNEETKAFLLKRLIPRATILTPNVPEAEILSKMTIKTEDDMVVAGRQLLEFGPKAILMKGGHLSGDKVVDILLTKTSIIPFSSLRINSRHTHGTGCTLASALACSLAQGKTIEMAVRRARSYVHEAIQSAPGFGKGHGPLNHSHTMGSP